MTKGNDTKVTPGMKEVGRIILASHDERFDDEDETIEMIYRGMVSSPEVQAEIREFNEAGCAYGRMFREGLCGMVFKGIDEG